MKEDNLGCHQGGILKMTGGTRITGVDGVFVVKEIDGNGEKEEDKKKSNIEMLSISPGHRIPETNNIRNLSRKSQIKTHIKIPNSVRKIK